MNPVILDFIGRYYFVVVYGITWFISVYAFKKYFDTSLKYFPIIIAYTFFTELLGSLIAYNEDFQLVFGYDKANHRYIIYNIYHLLFFIFFFYVYWKAITEKKTKMIIKYGAYLFVFTNFINLFFQNPLTEPLVYAYLLGVILLIYCLIMYFKNSFKENSIRILIYSLLFWVSLGLFAFHIIYFPIKIIREFYSQMYLNFRQLHLIMIVTMYVIFSIGFLVSRRRAFR
jgi:hypothetical protein